MYAIVDIAGQQFKVEKEQKIFVHRLEAEQGQKVEFDKVLLIDNDGKINVGTPVLEGAMVTAEVVSHLKGDKVKVFKKKRRKGYKKMNGHRQYLSEVVIEDILEKANKSKAKAKAEPKAAEKEEVKAEAKPKAAEKEVKAEAKPKAVEKKEAKAEAKPKATEKKETKEVKAEAKPKAAKKAETKKDEPVVDDKQEDKKED